jgi:hypothetical protein
MLTPPEDGGCWGLMRFQVRRQTFGPKWSEDVDASCGKFKVWTRKFKVPVRMLLILFKQNSLCIEIAFRITKGLSLQRVELKAVCISDVSNIIRVIWSRRIGWAGHVARWGQEMCIKGFGGETWGKRPFGIPRHKWEDINKMDLQEVGWESMDLTDMAQDRDRCRTLVNAAMNFRVP